MSNNGTFMNRYNGLIDVIEKNINNRNSGKDNCKDVSIAINVAAELHESPRSIGEIFRFITDIPLGSYIKLRKLEIAFSAKTQGKQPTWEKAALLVYDNVSSFKYAFKTTYGITVTDAEKNPESVQLTKPLYLDSLLKGRYTAMDYRTSFIEVGNDIMKSYELYGTLYNISLIQFSFAKDYVSKNAIADLEYVLYVLSKNYSDKAATAFTDIETKAFDLVIKFGYERKLAELLVNNLEMEGWDDLSDIEASYFRMMNDLLYFSECAQEEAYFTPKYLRYGDYLKVRNRIQSEGYNNYWDMYGAVSSTDESESWDEAVNQYLKSNPTPIKGDWSEDEYLIAVSISDSIPVADVFSFVEMKYGKENFAKICNAYDELVFTVMLSKDISGEEAVLFISDDENNELKQFLVNDYTLQFKYDRLKERGVL